MKRFLLILITLSTLAMAGGSGNGRGNIAVDLKLSIIDPSRAGVNASIDGTNISTDISSLSAKIVLGYFLNERYVFLLTSGVISADVKANVAIGNVTSDVSSVVPILFGLKYYFIDMEELVEFKPYFTASAGIFLASETRAGILSADIKVQSAMAASLAAGIDFYLSDWFKLNLEAGFNLAGDFNDPVGGKRNFSNGEFSIGLGFVF